jgi:hypothetical protein
MFKISCHNVEFEYSDHEAAKKGEAGFRGMRKNYCLIYPDGTCLECKFINSSQNPNT